MFNNSAMQVVFVLLIQITNFVLELGGGRTFDEFNRVEQIDQVLSSFFTYVC